MLADERDDSTETSDRALSAYPSEPSWDSRRESCGECGMRAEEQRNRLAWLRPFGAGRSSLACRLSWLLSACF